MVQDVRRNIYQYVPHDEIAEDDDHRVSSDAIDSTNHAARSDLVSEKLERVPASPLDLPPPSVPLPSISSIPSAAAPRGAITSDLSRRREEPTAIHQAKKPAMSSGPSNSTPADPSPAPRPSPTGPPPTAESTATARNRAKSSQESLPTLRRSTRTRKAPDSLTYNVPGNNSSALLAFNADSEPIIALKAKANTDPDIFTFDEAMQGEHRTKWMAAAQAEISALESKGTWKEVPATEATSRILPGTWVFRVKRKPDGEIKKFKSRYCCRGDLEEGSFDTYAPVVAFSTVRLFLVLSLLLQWPTCSIDFSNAFVQATLDKPVWIHLTTDPSTTWYLVSCKMHGTHARPKLIRGNQPKVTLAAKH